MNNGTISVQVHKGLIVFVRDHKIMTVNVNLTYSQKARDYGRVVKNCAEDLIF